MELRRLQILAVKSTHRVVEVAIVVFVVAQAGSESA